MVDVDRDNCVIRSKIGKLNATLLYCGDHRRGVGKEVLAVPLDKCGRGRAEGDNQVGRLFGKKRTKVLNKRDLRLFIAVTSGYQRMVRDIQRPW
jgi:hypothetical protein